MSKDKQKVETVKDGQKLTDKQLENVVGGIARVVAKPIARK